MLFRLNTFRCVVLDIPMDSVYAGERSSLRIGRVSIEFGWKHIRNFLKRIFYTYFLRDVSIASIQLLAGASLIMFGCTFGLVNWIDAAQRSAPAPLGTIMISVLPILIGVQLLMAFLAYDMASVPTQPVGRIVSDARDSPIKPR
jgi:hypothetical protein